MDAKETTAHPSYARNVNPHLLTHTSWEAADTQLSSALNATTTQKSNGGRRPILYADLGHKPVTHFNNTMAV